MTIQRNDKEQKQRIGYGVRLPIISLEESINAIKQVSRIGGESGSLDAFVTVFDNSRSSSTFTYKLAVLKNYGLITFDKLYYQLTEAGKRIVTPESMADEYNTIYEALKANEILFKIWENYKGKLFPMREYVAHFIENKCGIPAELKQAWADYFIAAARFSRILVERGESGSLHLLYEPQVIQEESESIIPAVAIPQSSNLPSSSREKSALVESVDSMEWGSINKPKLSNGRTAIFAIPDELADQDIEKLRVIIKGIEAGLDGLKKQQ